MKDIQFPVFKTKIKGLDKKFDLINPESRKQYFEAKAGPEIQKIKDCLKTNSFIAYLLGKKSAGKGTYAKMFAEVIGSDAVSHLSVGDMIRNVDRELVDEELRKQLIAYLKTNYRGWISFDKILDSLENRSTKTLLPNELILTLVKREIERSERKAIFLDGFPRNLDQVSFSLFFRELVGYRDDPDVFILFDVPENVIDQRIKLRRVCSVCNTSRHLKTLPTSKIGYDKDKDEFYLICDNQDCPECGKVRLVGKEGDEFGIERIRERLDMDEEIIKRAFSLYGIPKILLRNSVPKEAALESFDDYEITPEYVYAWNKDKNEVEVEEKPWEITDDKGVVSFSLLPPPVVVSLIKQLADILS